MNVDIEKLTQIVKPKGVVHIGASTFQELELYKNLGFNNRVWIEGDNNIPNTNGELCYYGYVGYREELRNSYIASNNGESSSILKPYKHLQEYPDIDFKQGPLVRVKPTSYYLDLIQDITQYNYLVLDIQGMEYEAIRGLGKYLHTFDVIITECYLDELYYECGKLDQIQNYLINFELFSFVQETGKSWGDAAFIKKLL